MNDPLFDLFLHELRAAIGPYPVVLRPLLATDDPDVTYFAWVLGVPEETLGASSKTAFEVLLRVYGASHVPFHLGLVSPEDAEARFGGVYTRTA